MILRSKKVIPGPAAPLPSKAGNMDSGDLVTGVIPYPSMLRNTGRPGLATVHIRTGIRNGSMDKTSKKDLGPAASSSFKTGQTDSGEVIAWEIPHPSESRTTGKPRPVPSDAAFGIRDLRPDGLRNHEIPFRGVASVAMEVF